MPADVSTPLRADLVGDECLRCGPVAVFGPVGHSSVRTLCQRLVRDGHSPDLRLHVYRGDALVERVSSLRDGSTSN